MSGSLNSRVSHITSYMTCGSLTGWLAGHGPEDSKLPLSGYATWLLWSGLSRFLPSQHLLNAEKSQLRSSVSHPQTTTLPFYRGEGVLNGIDSRWESNSGADASGTSPRGKLSSIHARAVDAGSAAKGGLRDVRVATVAELLLLALTFPQLRIPDQHAKALW